jgi:purine-cytosine permease-like protein
MYIQGRLVEFFFSLKTKITIFFSIFLINYLSVQTRFLNNLCQVRPESKIGKPNNNNKLKKFYWNDILFYKYLISILFSNFVFHN